MSLRLYARLKGYQPVYCLEDSLVLYRTGKLFRCGFNLRRPEAICTLPQPPRLPARLGLRVLRRIFRDEIRGAALFDGHLFFARRSTIFRVDLATGEASVDFEIPEGRGLLSMTPIKDGRSGEACLCFGEYLDNPGRLAVRVWRREVGRPPKWSFAETFPAGSINHIHGMTQLRGGIIFLQTGDFDDGAGLWLSGPAFTSPTPLLRGQSARACWMWEDPAGKVFYATDSQFDPNTLRVLDFSGRALSSVEVGTIAGSSIYASASASRVAFSTSVEPGALSGNLLKDVFERRPGPGIEGLDAVIYAFEAGEMVEVFRARKDAWPMRLAQFGAFQFPAGTPPPGRLFAYGVALSGCDDVCLGFADDDL